ncbi:hypothetical protein [Mycobacteroides chelonae]|uniref:hypothetical protein n=1 Tax=Mycobacteroides chelonae TaxID=1774 RepID=UPI0008A87A58|nr:hypothetical protein [Mycobacteroides chelonae]OHU64979.1 hypothetical protein BKG85_05095 [Mycobacteroides chelonae]
MTETSHALAQAHLAVDALFQRDSAVFGEDLSVYRGHVQRIVGLIDLQTPIDAETARPVAVAAFFHDAAIWYDRNWDYLPQSRERALAELDGDEQQFAPLVDAMINEHHRIRRARYPHPLVEAMRRADAVDVFRIPALARTRGEDYRKLLTRFPDNGFHRTLIRAFAHGMRENPFRPAPMVKF